MIDVTLECNWSVGLFVGLRYNSGMEFVGRYYIVVDRTPESVICGWWVGT